MVKDDPLAEIQPELLAQIVRFLRDWLPPQAREAYREMILLDSEYWYEDPHFAGGVIPKHILRGNGITEEVLGVEDLDEVWPALLEKVVTDEEWVGEE